MANRASTKTSTTRSNRNRNGNGEAQPVLGVSQREIQRFGTVIDLPIALDEKTRRQNCDTLNKILADSMILYNLYKKYHWQVAGHTFYQLHLLFDKHAGEQLELIDEIAERVQLLGGIAVGDPRHAAEQHHADESRRAPRGDDRRSRVPRQLRR